MKDLHIPGLPQDQEVATTPGKQQQPQTGPVIPVLPVLQATGRQPDLPQVQARQGAILVLLLPVQAEAAALIRGLQAQAVAAVATVVLLPQPEVAVVTVDLLLQPEAAAVTAVLPAQAEAAAVTAVLLPAQAEAAAATVAAQDLHQAELQEAAVQVHALLLLQAEAVEDNSI